MQLAKVKFKSLIDRMDANFYASRISIIKELHLEYDDIGNLCNFVRTKTPPRDLYFRNGVPVIKLKNIGDSFLQLKDTDYIPEMNYKKFIQPKPGDILLTATGEGTIGRVSIFEEDLKCILTAEVLLVRPHSIDPHFLFIYLHSPKGREQLERFARGSTGQTHLYSKDVALIPVPKIEENQRSEIISLSKESHKKEKYAYEKYREAESRLYEILNIKEYNGKTENTFETKSSEIFMGMRFDSEYYKPKYKKAIEALNDSGFKILPLKNCVDKKSRKINPRKNNFNDEIYYIEIGSIDVETAEISGKIIYGYESPQNAKRRLVAGDILISKVRPTRGAIAIIPEVLEGSVGSGAFYVCKPKVDIIPEYILLYLRSSLSLLQLGRPIAGSMYPTIKENNIENILVPIISKEEQKNIGDLVKKYFSLKKKARELLNQATQKLIQEQNNKS